LKEKVNYLPRHAALIAGDPTSADFAASTISSFGFEVTRFDSVEAFAAKMQEYLLDKSSSNFQPPGVAILAGPLGEFAQSKAAATLKSATASLPVVATGSSATVSDAVELMKQGASDVVELPQQREVFWERVQKSVDAADVDAAGEVVGAEMKARLDLLTPAEDEVIAAMLDGLANKQIAHRLGIGLRTVELRRSKIMRKMQAKSVAELVKFICQAGGISKQDQPSSEA